MVQILGLFVAGLYFYWKAKDRKVNRLLWTLLGMVSFGVSGILLGGLLILVLVQLFGIADFVAQNSRGISVAETFLGLYLTWLLYERIDQIADARERGEAARRTEEARQIVGESFTGERLSINRYEGRITRTGSRIEGGGSASLLLAEAGAQRRVVFNSDFQFAGGCWQVKESFSFAMVELKLVERGTSFTATILLETDGKAETLTDTLERTPSQTVV